MNVLLVMLTLVAASLEPARAHARPPEGTQDAAVSLPSTTAGKQLRWVLRVMNEEEDDRSPEAAASRMTDAFLERVSGQDVLTELAAIRKDVYDNKKVRAISVDQGERDDTMTAVLSAKGTQRYLSVFIIVDDKSGKIAGLRFEPAGGSGGGETPAPESGGSWQDMDKAMDEMQGDISFGCYEVVPRDPAKPAGELVLMDIAARNEYRVLAVASTFKLYVLGALAEDVAAGKHAWTDELAIQEAAKSLPSGRMQLLPAGTTKPLEEFATGMISISDNTAADHLIRLLTRERVEAYTNALNDNTGRNTPFLTTREAFALKLAADAALQEKFTDADDQAQRAMLAPGGELADLVPDLEQASDWGEPRLIESAEWFASAKQLAHAFMRLRQLEQDPRNEPLGRIMRKNPGLALDKSVWTSVAFKGGSEPGVLNMTWLLQRDDGRWYIFSVGQNDHARNIEQEEFNRLCYRGLAILAQDGRKQETPAPTPRPASPPRPDPFMDTGDQPVPPVDDGT